MASEGKGRRFTLPLRKAVGSLFKRKATTKEVIRQPHLAFREYHKYHQRSEASQQTYDTNVDSLDTLVTLVNELPDNEVTHFRLPRRGDRSVVHPRPERCRSFDDVGVPKTTASPDSGISGVLTQTVDEEYGSRQPYYKLDQPSNYSPEIPEPAVIKQTVVRLPHPSQDSSHKSSSVPHTGIGGGYSGGVILNTNGPSKDSRRMTGVKTLPATPEDFKFNGNYQASEEYNDIITNGIAANASKPGATPSSLRSGWSGTTRRDPSVTNKIRAIRFSYSSASSTLDDSISLNSTPSTPAPDGLPEIAAFKCEGLTAAL
ncbi:hypothetical protein G7Y89_g7304 [Cudoniella acicularis]|uniref:Uncharacterized protein n=1 Tax=Cudoniella acicularis TaxID=354080 RepID=A0A8H4RIV0_9HELO|nr:hypothetical protein G7Y89_g7304 [Cudoniella acicularis]